MVISSPLLAHSSSLLRRRTTLLPLIHRSIRPYNPARLAVINGDLFGRSLCLDFSRNGKHSLSASVSDVDPSDGEKDEIKDIFTRMEIQNSSTTTGTSFLTKLAVALGVAATVTLLSIYLRQPSSFGSSLPQFADASAQSVAGPTPVGFTLKVFGRDIILPEHTPGWVYFWLLMAAGCGLFISEEALNVWVGISLARSLTLDGSWQSFVNSFSANASFIVSTVLWVYWGVCISDMIPFYLGKLFRQSKASENIYGKLGIGKEKVLSITHVVQKYGNLSGFVERFSLGVRNPTAFLAGACGISAECFFAGVCCGGLITLPAQLAVGFLLRDRPVVALASVAAFVGIWTLFPYLIAASTALFLFFHPSSSSTQ